MRLSIVALALELLIMCHTLAATTSAEPQNPNSTELPKPSEIPGVQADILLRADVPNAPGRVLIVSRTTYKPGVHVAWHQHNSQIVFYVLEGTMDVQDQSEAPLTLKQGDSLLIKPGTVHRHWNASTTLPLVFLEYVLVNKGQPSAIFLK